MSNSSSFYQNLLQINMYTISGTAEVGMKIITFFPGVNKHFWGDWNHTLDDFFPEGILISNLF